MYMRPCINIHYIWAPVAKELFATFTNMDRNQSYRADVVVFAALLWDAEYLNMEGYKEHLNNTVNLLQDILGRVRIEIKDSMTPVVYSTSL